MHSEQAELGDFRDQLAREAALFEPGCDVRLDALVDERTDRISYEPLVIVQ